jgi:ERCC4-type nuclease
MKSYGVSIKLQHTSTMKSIFHLIIDSRESAVIPHIQSLFATLIPSETKFAINYEIKLLSIGDYIIKKDNQVIVAIERKTWDDLGSSIKDNRKDNVKKLLFLREQSKCRLLYLMETSSHRNNPDRCFGGIKFSYLESHLDRILIRDQIGIIFSKNGIDTAARLYDLIKHISTLDFNFVSPHEPADLLFKCPEVLVKPPNYNMWKCIPNVGNTISDLFVSENISVGNFLRNDKTEMDKISQLKMPTGGKIGKSVCNFFDNGGAVSAELFSSILSCVPRVSKSTADILLKTFSVKQILLGVCEKELSEVKVGKTKLGLKRAKAIIDSFK